MLFTWCIGPGLLFPWGVRYPIPVECEWYGGQKSCKIECRIIFYCYNVPFKHLLELLIILLCINCTWGFFSLINMIACKLNCCLLKEDSEILAKSSVAWKLLVDLLHPLDVKAARFSVVHHGFGVVDTDDALGSGLHRVWGVPWVVDILGRETSENR